MAEHKYENEQEWVKLGQKCPLWAALATPGKDWTDEEFLASGKNEIDEIFKLLKERGVSFTNDIALDFGCGPGRLSYGLSQYFDRVIGVDALQPMIDYAKTLLPSGEFVHTTDLSVFETNSVDFIYSNYVPQHIKPKNTVGYLQHFGRILKPGGLAVFGIPTGRRKTFKNILRSCVPNWKFIYKMLFGDLPVMEMHGM